MTLPAGHDPHRTFEPPVPERPAVPVKPVVARWAVRVAVVLLFAVTGVLTVLAISSTTGVEGLVVGLTLAVVPVVPVLAAFLWLDRYEQEPASLLLFAFGWGAAVATFASIVVNTASIAALEASGGNTTAAVVVVAPVVEETAKGLAVLAVFLVRRREFDGVVDGIVYAGITGIGFAFVENALYLGRAFLEGGSASAAMVFLLRAVVSPFAHPLFTIATGIGIGIAASRRRPGAWLFGPLLGWAAAVVLHSVWNLAALSGVQGFVTGYLVVQAPIFLGVAVLAVLSRRRESRLLARHLGTYARTGWLTTSEVRMLTALPERASARAWAERTGGPEARRAMRDFQELATELAFLRERMSHGTAPRDAAETELRTLYTLWHLRSAFLPRRSPVDGL